MWQHCAVMSLSQRKASCQHLGRVRKCWVSAALWDWPNKCTEKWHASFERLALHDTPFWGIAVKCHTSLLLLKDVRCKYHNGITVETVLRGCHVYRNACLLRQPKPQSKPQRTNLSSADIRKSLGGPWNPILIFSYALYSHISAQVLEKLP